MKKQMRLLGFLLAAAVLSAGVMAVAAATVGDTVFSDVDAGSWYADAVEYVRENGLMSGTTATTFNPEGTTSRGQIAAILYRAAGSPAVSGGTDFPMWKKRHTMPTPSGGPLQTASSPDMPTELFGLTRLSPASRWRLSSGAMPAARLRRPVRTLLMKV